MTSPAALMAREIADLRDQVAAMARASQMSRRSVEDGGIQVFDDEGTLRGVIGLQDDGTTALVTVNDPTPPTPSAPIVSPLPGGLEITWDGTFEDGVARPSDFGKIEVHASPLDVYTPSEVTLRSSMIAAGTVTVDLPPDPYTVVFVVHTTGGSDSRPSLPATETPAPLGGDGVDQTARDIANAAQARADQAVADAAAAKAAADAAEASSEAVTGDVAAAQQAADDAASQASAALTAAQNAGTTGTSAQQAADLARSAADAAKQAADASGTAASAADAKAADAAAKAAQAIADAAAANTLAATKATTIRQNTQPTGTAYTVGDIWIDTANGERMSRWNGTGWTLVQDKSIATALAAANAKNRIFTQATQPTGTAYIAGDLWIDTANGRRLSAWDPAKPGGAGWVVQQFGNLAIAPGTLVASDVIAQGTITAALIKGDAIDGKTITGALIRTAASLGRLELDSANGLRGFAPDGTTVKTQITTDGHLTAVDATISGEVNTAVSGARVRMRQIADQWGNNIGTFEMATADPKVDPAYLRLIATPVQPSDPTNVAYATLSIRGPAMDVTRGIVTTRSSPTIQMVTHPTDGTSMNINADKITANSPGTAWSRGIVARTAHSTTLSMTGGTEVRLAGSHNMAGINLQTGRAYDVFWTGGTMNVAAISRPSVTIRAAKDDDFNGVAVAPTTTSPVASQQTVYMGGLGTNGRTQLNSSGQPFQVSQEGAYSFHAFLSNISTNAADLVAGFAGHGIMVVDLGLATAGLRTLL